MAKPFWEERIFPEKLFRLSVLVCIVLWGLSAVYVASNHGTFNVAYVRARALALYFFTAIWIFGFFYVQYRLVPRLIRRDLDHRLSQWHAFGTVALFVSGALYVLSLQTPSDVTGDLLLAIAVLGECVLVGNVIWTNVRGTPKLPPPYPPVKATPAAVPTPAATLVPAAVPEDSLKNAGWPKSPVKLFGIGAGVFVFGGLISLALHVPASKIPVLWSGQVHFVSFFYLWLAAAAPFVIFALLYKYLIDVHRLPFAESMNRIHFVVTIIAVLDLVRVFVSWEEALVSKSAELLFGSQFVTLAVVFLFDLVVFAVSAIDSYRRSVART